MRFLLSIIFLFVCSSGLCQDSLLLPGITKNSSPDEIKIVLDSLQEQVFDSFYENRFTDVIRYGDYGIELAKRIGEETLLFKFHRIYASALLRMKDTVRAKNIFLANHEKALIAKDSSYLVRTNLDFGNFYNETKDWNQAIRYYKKAITFCNETETRQLFILNFNISEILLDEKRIDHAEFYINRSNEYVNKLSSPKLEAAFYLTKGRLLLEKSNYSKAIEHFHLAIEMAEEEKYIDVILDGYEYQILALEKKGDFKEIHRFRKKVDEFNAKKNVADKEKAIQNIIVKMNVEQYEQELKAKKLENELNMQKANKNRIISWVMIGSTLVLFVLLLGIYKLYKKRNRLVLMLQEKNKLYLTAKRETDHLSKVKNNFLSAVTHELRTPLYGIIGISSILQQEVKLKEHQNDVDSLKFSADYLLALINDVLYLNKLDALEEKELAQEPFKIHELVSNIINSLEFMKTKNNNQLVVKIEDNVPLFLRGDFVKLSQILINLVSNACKFTEEGIIRVSISATIETDGKAELSFCVKDNGIGISKKKQKVIFNEFTQDANRSKFQGTGLGLAIVKRLLDLHESPINLTSETNQGTEFQFSITYHIAKEEEFKELVKANEIDKAIEGGHILIVDDNKINRLVTKKVLERNKFVCCTAENGELAIEFIKNEVFDLVLMDLNMPVMDGFEATKYIRNFNKTIPIIALTASDQTQLEDNIYESGFTDLIVKPYKDDDFIDVVKSNFLAAVSI